jgi:hypothetical protein
MRIVAVGTAEEIIATGAIVVAILISLGMLAGSIPTPEGASLIASLIGGGILIRLSSNHRRRRSK